MNTSKGNAALYLRVSTRQQTEKSSLESQKDRLIYYAKHVLHCDAYEIFTDPGFTGTNDHRPAYQRMLAGCRKGLFQYVVVTKIDRISRSLHDFARMYDLFQKTNICFISIDEHLDTRTPMGEMIVKLGMVFAEVEDKTIGERSFSMTCQKIAGGLLAFRSVPYGYRKTKDKRHLEIDEDKAPVVRDIYRLFLEEECNYNQICRWLNNKNIRPVRASKWNGMRIKAILTNPAYIGTYRYNVGTISYRPKNPYPSTVIPHAFPAIISEENWKKAQERIKTQILMVKHPLILNIFQGLIRCGACGRKMSRNTNGFEKYQYHYYLCREGPHGETHTRVIRDYVIGEFLLTYMQNLLYIQTHPSLYPTKAALETGLLKGTALSDVQHITNLDALFYSLTAYRRFDVPVTAVMIEKPMDSEFSTKLTRIREKLQKLKQDFLYGDVPVPLKTYLIQKEQLKKELEAMMSAGLSFPEKAVGDTVYSERNMNLDSYILQRILTSKDPINFRELTSVLGRQSLYDFFHEMLDFVSVFDGKITSIRFANGLTHFFAY